MSILEDMSRPEAPAAIVTREILAERMRQINIEGFSPGRDDCYTCDELSDAAACFAAGDDSVHWPGNWDREWFGKHEDRRKQLIIAGALIVAEIERMDRAKNAA